jgi:GPH family glycoside/pentoside/hexuronide:cation symporter
MTGGDPAPALGTKLREKVLYAFGDVGNAFIWTFTSSFLVLYYTDSVGVSAAFVGSMMLIARVLDGGSDLLQGLVIEKTATRFGKARPWVLFGALPFALSLVATFNVPGGLEGTARHAYIAATYVFMTVVCYTVVNLSYHAMLARITLVQHERAVISTFRVVITLAAALGIAFATEPLLRAFGGVAEQTSWTGVSGLYAALGLAFLLACFFGTKEKVAAVSATGQALKKTPIGQAFGHLARTRYFYIVVLVNIVMAVFNGILGGYVYYARDVLGNVGLFGVLSACTMLPIVLVAPFTPKLFQRFGKRNTILAGFALTIVCGAVQCLFPANVAVAVVTMSVRSLGLGPVMTASSTFPGDIVDYLQWKNGFRAEGIVSSVMSFGSKVGTGLGSAMLGWFLAAGGYAGELPQQPQSVLAAEIGVVVVMPLVLCTLSFIGMWFWNIDKYRPQIDGFLAQGTLR